MPHDNSQIDVPNNHIQIGGRKSKLAVVQSETVSALILSKFPQLKTSILALSTLGDKVQTKPLYSFGGKSLWTKELEILLIDAIVPFPKLDLIVHSLKDMPTNLPDEFELGCIVDRVDPRDAVVMKAGSPYTSLSQLPAGTMVGTSSIRRSSQLMKNYPHLTFDSVRGNLGTRISKLDAPDSPFECLILAAAGLDRIDLGHRITQRLDAPEMYYAVGQGALGIEIRKGDPIMKQILARIEDVPASLRCHAERSLMRYLEGGCSVPIGVGTSYDVATQVLNFKAIIVSPDGTSSVEDEVEAVVTTKEEADQLGITLADKLVAKGAREILENIDFSKINQAPSSINNTPTDSPIPTPAVGTPTSTPRPAAIERQETDDIERTVVSA